MKTFQSPPSSNDAYFKLVKKFPLKAIHDDDYYDRAIEVINVLLDRDLDFGEEEYLDALTTLVETYEKELPDFDEEASLSDVLRFLMQSNGDSQATLVKKAEISKSLLSELLSGGRAITLPTARKIAAAYSVPASVFINRAE